MNKEKKMKSLGKKRNKSSVALIVIRACSIHLSVKKRFAVMQEGFLSNFIEFYFSQILIFFLELSIIISFRPTDLLFISLYKQNLCSLRGRHLFINNIRDFSLNFGGFRKPLF